MPFSPTPDDLHLLLREADAAARRLLRKLGLPHADLEDLRQDLLTDLIARLRGYDPARGPLGAFAGVVLRHQASRIVAKIVRERQALGAPPLSLDEPVPDADGATRGDLLAEEDGLSAWHGQPTDAVTEVERRLDVEKALGALDERDGALCAALSIAGIDQVARAKAGARTTLYRRVRHVRLALTAHGLAPSWDDFQAA